MKKEREAEFAWKKSATVMGGKAIGVGAKDRGEGDTP